MSSGHQPSILGVRFPSDGLKTTRFHLDGWAWVRLPEPTDDIEFLDEYVKSWSGPFLVSSERIRELQEPAGMLMFPGDELTVYGSVVVIWP